MRQLLLIFLLGAVAQCYAGTFDLDTIDNWQIYNGTELVLAGHDSPLGAEFHGTIRTSDLKGLAIQFNHCTRYNDLEVILQISDEEGKNILTKTFRTNSGTRMTIDRKELGLLTSKSITIRYQEKRENGTDKILGKIRFV
jgi:hypothetical protein